jgi:signal peptidase II
VRGLQERGTVAALSPRRRAPAPTDSGARPSPTRPRRLIIGLATAGLVVATDQVTKSLAVAHLSRPVHLLGPFGLALGYNSGAAFSLFTKAAPVLGSIDAVLALGLGWLAWRARSGGVALSAGLVLGGALGNLCDRLFRAQHGSVVDFITLSHWPTFNVADACITLGVLSLVVAQLRHGLVAPSAPAAPAAGSE